MRCLSVATSRFSRQRFATSPTFFASDVLVKNGEDVDLIEVKAHSYDPGTNCFFGKRDSTRLRAEWEFYLDDIAFQTWVARQAYPEWKIHPLPDAGRQDPKDDCRWPAPAVSRRARRRSRAG